MPHLVFSFVKLQAVLSSDKVVIAKNVQSIQTNLLNLRKVKNQTF